MKHVLKSSKMLHAPYAIYMHQQMCADKDLKRAGRSLHKIYPSLSKQLISGLIKGEVKFSIEGDDAVFSTEGEGKKIHRQSMPKETIDKAHATDQGHISDLTKGHMPTKRQTQRQINEEKEKLAREKHMKMVKSLADMMNRPVVKIIENPKRNLPAEVLIDGIIMLMKHHLIGFITSFGSGPEIREFIGNKIGELTAFVIGMDYGDDNKRLPTESTDQQGEKKGVPEMGE